MLGSGYAEHGWWGWLWRMAATVAIIGLCLFGLIFLVHATGGPP
jgi:hypothetical protein